MEKTHLRILCFGFGTTPVFFHELIKLAAQQGDNITWSTILPTSHHELLVRSQFDSEKILILHKEIARYLVEPLDLRLLKGYPGNLWENVETEKFALKNRASSYQMSFALAAYRLLKNFLVEQSPDVILYAQPPEGMVGVMLAGLGEELNIRLAVPHHTRHLQRTFFSNSAQEVLSLHREPDSPAKAWAMEFLQQFRLTGGSCSGSPLPSLERHLYPQRNLSIRTGSFLSRLWKERHHWEQGRLKVTLLNNFPRLRNFIWRCRTQLNRNNYNCGSVSELPERFIFYPLQYSPESSINVPAPYFIDQMRVIDKLRMAMPNDYLLVVKEHPACITVRPAAFTRQLLKKAGVVVISYREDTQEVIKKSALTVSVTGTAAFEAFLYGRPSIVLAETFFSELIGGVTKLDQLEATLKLRIASSVQDDQILEGLARIHSASADFVATAPDGRSQMLQRDNIIKFWRAFDSYLCEGSGRA